MVRILKASACYPGYIHQVYHQSEGLCLKAYEVQHRALMDGCFAWSDFLKTHLEDLADCTVFEVVVNADEAQRAWARENSPGCKAWTREDIFLEQLRWFMPDVLFLHGHSAVRPGLWRDIKALLPTVMIVGYDGVRFESADYFQGMDGILSPIEDTVEFYCQHGFRAFFLPHAFEPSILSRLGPQRRDLPLTFVGQLSPASGLFHGRARIVRQISRVSPIECWADLSLPGAALARLWKAVGNGEYRAAAWELFKRLPGDLLLRGRIRGTIHSGVYGIPYFRVLARSQITLNVHTDVALSNAANMRLFEATGCGACLVTDWKEDLKRFYDLERDLVTFRSPAEANEKIKFLLDHPTVAAEIAQRGQRRTIEQNNVRQQAISLWQYFNNLLSAKDLDE